jgi:hypothetical protein
MRLTGESSFRYHFSSDGQGGEVAGRDRKKPRQGGAGRQVGHQGGRVCRLDRVTIDARDGFVCGEGVGDQVGDAEQRERSGI